MIGEPIPYVCPFGDWTLTPPDLSMQALEYADQEWIMAAVIESNRMWVQRQVEDHEGRHW